MEAREKAKRNIDDFSKKVCIFKGCTKYLKQNLVDKNPKAEYCFQHYPRAKHNRPSGNNRR